MEFKCHDEIVILTPSLTIVFSSLLKMTPALTTATALPTQVDSKTKNALPKERPTHILHRTPWRPPVAVSGQGIYLTLESGQTVIDGCGGAAVACIGMGHPAPLKALKDQVDKLSCKLY